MGRLCMQSGTFEGRPMTTANMVRQGGGFSTFTNRVLIVVVVIAVVLLVWHIAYALLLAFVGILLAATLRALAGLVGRALRIPMSWALPLVVLVLLAAIAVFVRIAGPRINGQLSQLMTTLPNSIKEVEEQLSEYSWAQFILGHLAGSQLNASEGVRLFSRVTGIASAAVAVLADAIIVIFTAVYFAINPGVYRKGLLSLVPKNRSRRMAEVLDATGRTLQHWLLGQAIAMLSVGILTMIGLSIVGIPSALVLGVISGALEFIPFLGPILAAIPGILIAATQGWRTAVYATVVYLIVQQLENHLLIPLIQRRVVQLPPALIVLAVVALGILFGPLGALIATPLTAVVMVWVKMLYVEDVLDKPAEVK
jgi:predicted PurR-regulated permease PerM